MMTCVHVWLQEAWNPNIYRERLEGSRYLMYIYKWNQTLLLISANLQFFCLNLNHIFFSHSNIRTIQFPVSSTWKSIGRLTQEQSMKMESSKQNTNILIQSKLNCLQKLQLIYYMKSNWIKIWCDIT